MQYFDNEMTEYSGHNSITIKKINNKFVQFLLFWSELIQVLVVKCPFSLIEFQTLFY
jgi:hypothetical protein